MPDEPNKPLEGSGGSAEHEASSAPGHDHDHDHGAERHRDHDHDHAHDPFHVHPGEPLNVDELDPANRSLAEALRISFAVLRFVMILLIIAFAISGLRQVREGQAGLRLHFGAIQGNWADDPETGGREFVASVLDPGWHFAWPEPIDRIVVVPTTTQQVQINQAFWPQISDTDATKSLDEINARPGGLQPGVDGSMITGDRNLVHAQWTITFHVDPRRVDQFVRHIGMARPGDPDAAGNPLPNTPDTPMYWARRHVTAAAEAAVVQIAATTDVDDFVKGEFDRPAAQAAIQRALDEISAGIVVERVLMNNPTAPLAVRPDFQAVGIARSEADRRREEAERTRSRLLNEVAGQGYEVFISVLDQYERATALGDPAGREAGGKAIAALLDGQPAREALAPLRGLDEMPALIDAILTEPGHRLAAARISGQASSVIAEAQSDRTGIEARVQAEAEDFLKRYHEFAGDPQLERITRRRLWEDMRQRVLTGEVETFYLPREPGKTIYLEAGRDPRIAERREQAENLQRIQQGASD